MEDIRNTSILNIHSVNKISSYHVLERHCLIKRVHLGNVHISYCRHDRLQTAKMATLCTVHRMDVGYLHATMGILSVEKYNALYHKHILFKHGVRLQRHTGVVTRSDFLDLFPE